MPVKSVQKYISKIDGIVCGGLCNISVTADARGLTHRLFFRGQPGDYGDTNNVASIFRKGSLSNTHEYAFTNEYMRRFNTEFNGLENNFSRLSYMQHFGLPTRLVDVTTNSLVALYFACQSKTDKDGNEEDGVVSVFLSNQSNDGNGYTYFNSRSDTVEILSTLSLMDEERKDIIFSKIYEFNAELKKRNYLERYSIWYDDQVGKYPKGYYKQLPPSEKKIYRKITKLYSALNDSYEVRCLYRDIKRDSGYFENVIDFTKILHPFFVEPSINNERLRAQSGFFLFEPYNGASASEKDINSDVLKNVGLKDGCGNWLNIQISGSKKQSILRELDLYCGINKARLFPDKENVAHYVKNDFLK